MCDEVPCFFISRLSRTSRFCCRAVFFLFVKVAMIFGSSQLICPDVQWRACLEIPDIFSSSLLDVVSEACWPMRVRNETRVCPMYFAFGLQSHES